MDEGLCSAHAEQNALKNQSSPRHGDWARRGKGLPSSGLIHYIRMNEYSNTLARGGRVSLMAEAIATRAAAELLKAFSHPTRLAILQELIAGPKCVTDMEELLPARQANISQHLSVLRYAKLVDYAQDGTLRCYYLCRPGLVADMLSLVGRNEPVLKRSPEQIRADKERVAQALADRKAPKKNSAKRRRQVRQ